MPSNTQRKTHPMVLIAAIALTIFSVLGSAAITGLIPSALSEKAQTAQPSATNSNDSSVANSASRQIKNAPLSDRFKSRLEPSTGDKASACSSCGVIMSIHAVVHANKQPGLIAEGISSDVSANQGYRADAYALMPLTGAAA